MMHIGVFRLYYFYPVEGITSIQATLLNTNPIKSTL